MPTKAFWVKTLPDDEDDVFEIARGPHVGAVRPEDGFEPRLSISWPRFVKLVSTFSVSENKVGPYICRPMGGDGSRSDANALPTSVFALDVDELLPEDVPGLYKWCANGLELVLATTFSHTEENPRFRLWIKCSRLITAQEHLLIFHAFNQVQVFPFKLDPATAKPSQPIYLPRVPEARKSLASAEYYPGYPLDVDRVLQEHQKELDRLRKRNEQGRFVEGKGVRVPGGTIDSYNKHTNVTSLLEKHGYTRRSQHRFTAPGSKSRRAGVLITDEGKVLSYHDPEHDPLAQRDEFHQPRIQDAFAVYNILEHNDDFLAAFRAAARLVHKNDWAPSASEVFTPAEEQQKISECASKFKPAAQALRDAAPREFVVEGLLPKKDVTLVTGRSNSGKTTVLEYLALCVASGINFATHECKKGPVLWIAGEDAHNAVFRIGGMCAEYNIDIDSLDEFHVYEQPIQVLDKPSMEIFKAGLKEYIGKAQVRFQLIAIDSKSTCWGGENENSNDENAWFIQELKKMADEFDAAIIVTHHLSKGSDDDEPTARGASSLINNTDHEWRSTMNATSTVATLEPGTKLRLPRWKPIRFGVKVVTLPDVLYPWLLNSRGDMPQISLVEPGKIDTPEQKASNLERVAVLVALRDGTLDLRAVNESIAQLLNPDLNEQSSPADKKSAANHARELLRKMKGKEQLVDVENKPTKLGHRFIEQYQDVDSMIQEAKDA